MHDDVVVLTQSLIEISSISGNETQALKFVEQWLVDNKFDSVERTDRFVCARVRAAHGHGATTRAVILCGHIDTVSPGDESRWTYGPWTPEIKDDRLYGLGSGDMKAGVALQLMAAKAYKTAPRDYDVWIAVVADEEVSGAGSDAFTRYFDENTDYKAAYCIIAEPTDQGTIEIGHRGNRFVKLTFRGQAAHASQEASYAASATPTAVAFLTALPAVRKELHKKFAHDLMGEPSFTPTKVGHGEAFSLNKTTDIATVSVDIRTTPALDDAFDAWIKDLAVTYHFEWEYEAGYVPSALCDDDAAILTTALQSMNDAKTAISHGATDQAFFQRYGIQTIVFGPGDFALAHTCDESVSINRIKEVSALYTHILSQV